MGCAQRTPIVAGRATQRPPSSRSVEEAYEVLREAWAGIGELFDLLMRGIVSTERLRQRSTRHGSVTGDMCLLPWDERCEYSCRWRFYHGTCALFSPRGIMPARFRGPLARCVGRLVMVSRCRGEADPGCVS